MPEIWFTSDTHFGHENIVKHCARPFVGVDEMDEALIANWNEAVGPKDHVYHLGDFAWYRRDVTELTDRLNGRIHLVLGNHDKPNIKGRFVWVKPYYRLKTEVSRHKIELFHYPMLAWRNRSRNAWHLHGHSHSTKNSWRWELRYDVGVDANEYRPVSLQQICAWMDRSTFDRFYRVRSEEEQVEYERSIALEYDRNCREGYREAR